MSLDRLLSEQWTIIRRTSVGDAYGSHDTWTDHTTLPGRMAAASSYENQETWRDTAVGFDTLVLAGAVDITAAHRVRRELTGRVYAVEGEPAFDAAPGGRLSLTTVRLRIATDQ